MSGCAECAAPAVVAGRCRAHLTATRPALHHPCDHCHRPHGRYYVVRDRLLHLCEGCWSADTATVLDILNIPTGER